MKISKALDNFKKSSNNSLSIFLFHGIISKSENKKSVTNYNRKHINIKDFKSFLKNVLKYGENLSMNKIFEDIKAKKKIKTRSFAITFDDGFENNISVAAPILFDLGVAFTIYLTTKFVDKNEMSWIDKIDYAVDTTKKKSIVIFELNKKFKIITKKDKIFLLEKLRKFLKKEKKIDPYSFANKLCNQLGVKKFPINSQIYKKMNWNQIRKISRNKLCIIGGHTHTHRILSYLNNKDLSFEIKKSVKLIKKNVSIKPLHYSYPEGFKRSFSTKVINMLKRNDIKCCPTAIEGINMGKLNPFLLKRISIT